MAKPIFLVGVPKIAPIQIIQELQKSLESKYEDYYILVYRTSSSELEFRCFFEKDFDEVKYEELKQIVRDAVK
jgi:hypothetical protein